MIRTLLKKYEKNNFSELMRFLIEREYNLIPPEVSPLKPLQTERLLRLKQSYLTCELDAKPHIKKLIGELILEEGRFAE